MKYESQRVAYWFVATCMLLFGLQIVYGFIMAFAHVGYDVLHDVIPFHVARATHTNLLVMAPLGVHGRGVLHHPGGV